MWFSTSATNGRSRLPEILTRAGPLPAVHPAHGETIVEGKVYVAPPDCHLLIETDLVRLSRGPGENQTRPAVNPLVTGVILTGALDDGTAGLAEIRRRGGTTVVQDPETAAFPSMPSNAIAGGGSLSIDAGWVTLTRRFRWPGTQADGGKNLLVNVSGTGRSNRDKYQDDRRPGSALHCREKDTKAA